MAFWISSIAAPCRQLDGPEFPSSGWHPRDLGHLPESGGKLLLLSAVVPLVGAGGLAVYAHYSLETMEELIVVITRALFWDHSLCRRVF